MIFSPFLLAATIKFQEGTSLALEILKNIYVNNIAVGVNSISETTRKPSEFLRKHQ